MSKKKEDTIFIFSNKLNRNVNINEIIESLMFFNIDEIVKFMAKEKLYTFIILHYIKIILIKTLNTNDNYSKIYKS